jgi:hypothetical protein
MCGFVKIKYGFNTKNTVVNIRKRILDFTRIKANFTNYTNKIVVKKFV